MKKIKLTQNKYALVDNEDYPILSMFNWYANKNKTHRTFYAVRVNGNKKIHMHRYILGTPKGMETDHIDGNGLNNQKKNLRICDHAENQRNKDKPKNNTSGFKGVSWCERNKKWLVRISLDRERIYLGHFKSKMKAYEAYCKGCIKYHGKFAKLK